MIVVPKDYQNNPAATRRFLELVTFFNELEKELEYPNCEGKEDAKRILARAEDKLIMRGVL